MADVKMKFYFCERLDNFQFAGKKQIRQFYKKTALEHLCVKA